MGLNKLNQLWTFQVSFVFPPPPLVTLVESFWQNNSQVSAEFAFQLNFVGWRLLGFLLLPIHWRMFLSKGLIRNVSVDWMLNGLLSKHLTLWVLRDILCRQEFSLLVWQAVAGSTQTSERKVNKRCRKGWTGCCELEGVLTMSHLVLNQLKILFIYLGLDWLCVLLVLPFTYFFICSIFLLINIFIPRMLKWLFSCERVGL